jgi:hypothetical protein
MWFTIFFSYFLPILLHSLFPTTHTTLCKPTYNHIHMSLILVCLSLPSFYLPQPFSNIHHQPSLIISILFPFFFSLTTHLSYDLHTPFPPVLKHSQDHLFTMLLTLTIPPFIPFQIPSPNTPSFKYLHITNSLHHTSCYYINTHHSFGTKLLTLPIFSYPYHLFIPSHIAHIFPPITNIFILRAHLSKHSPTNYFLSHSLLSTTNYLYHLPLLYIEP